MMRLLRGRREERELDAELRDHLERQVADHVRAGVGEGEARRRAQLAIGGVEQVKEACRDARGTVRVEQIGRDMSYALRQVRRQPLFWGALILTLVAGIGASTALFAIVHGVLLRPLAYPDPDQLLALDGLSYKGEFAEVRERSRALTAGAYLDPAAVSVTGTGEPIRLDAAAATGALFEVLRVEAAAGRRFGDADSRPGAAPVVILSDGLWRDRFGADRAAVGRTLRIDGTVHTIVGVMPRTFDFPAGAALWRPLAINAADPIDLWARNARSIGRLRPGASELQARDELRRLIPALRERFPWRMPADYGTGVGVTPLREALVGDVRATLLVLFGAVVTVLLVLAVNVATLLLTRGLARERELATRAAIGASRGRLVQQLAVESLTIAGLSGALGIAAAAALLHVVVAWLPADVPRAAEIHIDGPVLLVALGLTLAAGLFFGLVPAIRASARAGLTGSLRAAGSVRLQVRERRLARLLAVAELALAVVLVVSAALLARSLANLMAVDPGFRAAPLVTATVAPPAMRYTRPDQRRRFAADLVARLRDLPGVRAAAAASAMPFAGGSSGSVFSIEGRPDPATETGEWPGADIRAAVGPDFLRALGTPVVEGRGITDADREGAPAVALVSRSLARRYWGTASPLGARIRFPGRDAAWVTIVGVVGDVKWQQLGEERSPFFGGTAQWLGGLFLPLAQADANPLHIVLRVDGNAAPVAAQLRALVRAVDADAAIADITSGETLLAASAARPRTLAVVLTAFAAVALALGAVGVYAVLAYSVSRRRQEFAVRVAVGGTSAQILRAVVGEGLRLTLIGVALGVAGALVATRLLSRLLFGVAATDPGVFAAVTAALMAVGLLASYLPARRAMRVNPITALHGD